MGKTLQMNNIYFLTFRTIGNSQEVTINMT